MKGAHVRQMASAVLSSRQILKGLSRGAYRPPTPPNATLLEAAKAHAEAAKQPPLTYAMGEPLPGRSALDRKRGQ